MVNDSKTSLPILQKRLDVLQHNLLSLETTLTNACKLQTINERGFKKRAAVVNHLRTQIIHFRRTLEENTKNASSVHDFGLPLLNVCTYDELDIIDRILSQRLHLATHALQTIQRVHHWIETSSKKKRPGIMSTIRLSYLKKTLARLEKRLSLQDIDERNLHNLRRQLISFMKKQKMRDHEDVEPLIQLFKQLDLLTSHVAKLKSTIDKQEYEIRACERWLLENDRAPAERDFDPAPSNDDLSLAQAKVEGPDYSLVRKAQQRIEYARQYVGSCFGSEDVQPVKGATTRDRFDAF
ncbi:MAG: hypothetical protein AB7T49_18295 [Oligoflexales bacterium]